MFLYIYRENKKTNQLKTTREIREKKRTHGKNHELREIEKRFKHHTLHTTLHFTKTRNEKRFTFRRPPKRPLFFAFYTITRNLCISAFTGFFESLLTYLFYRLTRLMHSLLLASSPYQGLDLLARNSFATNLLGFMLVHINVPCVDFSLKQNSFMVGAVLN